MDDLLGIVIFIVVGIVANRYRKTKQQQRPGQPTSSPAPTSYAGRWAELIDQFEQTASQMSGEKPIEGEAAESPGHGAEIARPNGEGDSRDCEHGQVGGSLAFTDHEGLPRERQESSPEGESDHGIRKPASSPSDTVQLAAPIVGGLTPEELRRAVVISEVLKRPAERRGRWMPR